MHPESYDEEMNSEENIIFDSHVTDAYAVISF